MRTPFFTEMDPSAQLQGSRDPLGAQAVWSLLGRQLVGNLTLATGDVAGFRTLIIGYGLAGETKDLDERVRIFLRWEQAAAAARVAAEDDPPPVGAQRVRQRLSKSPSMSLSEEHHQQILDDQRRSGLWSLYHRPARDSGLVDDQRRLTRTGHALFNQWVERLPANICRKVTDQGERPVRFGRIGAATEDSTSVAKLLRRGTSADRSTLRDCLVLGRVPDGRGGLTPLADGRQQRLAALLATQTEVDTWRQTIPTLREAATKADDRELASSLDDVLIAESVLLPAQAAFDDLLVNGHGSTLTDFADRLRSAWPAVPRSVRATSFKSNVHPKLVVAIGAKRAEMWVAMADAMAASDWPQAARELVAINGDLMFMRGGGAWAKLNAKDIIEVALPAGAPLLDESEVLEGWRNPYYLDPLLLLQQRLDTGSRR